MSQTLTQCHHQWATRPDDERFVSLPAMRDHFQARRDRTKTPVISSRGLVVQAVQDNQGLVVLDKKADVQMEPTNWAFGQLCQLNETPAGYMRELGNKRAAPLAAACLNVGIMTRGVEELGIMRYENGKTELECVTGPNYGRVWQNDVLDTLIPRFGDGVTGTWKVPGEFGRDVRVTKANTTLYAGDRDMFIFLADEKNRVEFQGRRPGVPGQLARGFFLQNSMHGKSTLKLSTFYFDYVCCNRFVWGAEGFQEIAIRHTSGAPDRWLDEVTPALEVYRNTPTTNIVNAIENARKAKITQDVDDYMAKLFGKNIGAAMQAVHVTEEQRPVETLWDVVTAATAYAKGIQWQDKRVELETKAGSLLTLAS